MEALPAYELTKSFRLRIAIFTITAQYTVRRECGHAWHNLPDRRQSG
ncbi:hypothetical protein AB0J81_04440 [Streptomyces bobili]